METPLEFLIFFLGWATAMVVGGIVDHRFGRGWAEKGDLFLPAALVGLGALLAWRAL